MEPVSNRNPVFDAGQVLQSVMEAELAWIRCKVELTAAEANVPRIKLGRGNTIKRVTGFKGGMKGSCLAQEIKCRRRSKGKVAGWFQRAWEWKLDRLWPIRSQVLRDIAVYPARTSV